MDSDAWRTAMALLLYAMLLLEIFYLPCWMKRYGDSWTATLIWAVILLTGFYLWYVLLMLPRYLGWVH